MTTDATRQNVGFTVTPKSFMGLRSCECKASAFLSSINSYIVEGAWPPWRGRGHHFHQGFLIGYEISLKKILLICSDEVKECWENK